MKKQTGTELALQILREYLKKSIPASEAISAAASEAANKTGENYFALKSAISFLQFGAID